MNLRADHDHPRRSRAHALAGALLFLSGLIAATSAVTATDLARERTADQERAAAEVEGGTVTSEADDGDGLAHDSGEPPLSGATDGGDGGGGDGGAEGGTAGGTEGASEGADPDGSVAFTGGPPLKIAYLILDLTGAGSLFPNDPTQGRGDDEADREEREFLALIDDLNASGGLAGRRVEARGFLFSIPDLDPPRLLQRCVEITEDYGADYVIDTFLMTEPAVMQCFAQHQVGLVTFAGGLSDPFLKQMAPYVATTFPTIERQFRSLVPNLQKTDYFSGATVGVFLDASSQLDEPYSQILEPALEEAGAKPAAIARSSSADTGATGNAVLKFRSANVTHIIFVGNITHFSDFANVAEAQGYRPRYAFPEYINGLGGITLTGHSQLRNAVGVSACDYFNCVTNNDKRVSSDVSTPYDRADLSPGLRRCLDSLSRVRNTDYYNPGEAGASVNYFHICNHWFLWVDAMKASTGRLDPHDFGVGLAALGTSYLSPYVHATDFGAFPQSGSSHFAAGVFDDSCRCFVRQTPWTRSD